MVSATRRRHAAALVALVATTACAGPRTGPSAPAPSAGATAVAPERGALVVVGGGRVGADILARFLELAGGKDVPIVIIPTAGGDTVTSAYGPECACARLFRDAGATDVTVLHTYDRKVADTEAFVAPIRRARAVWFPGGRQWRLVDSYLGTRTERELHAVLARGGVVGGTSAGASIQASYLVRGAREGNTIMMAPGYEQGFAFLRGVAVDQHVSQRNRQVDLQQVLGKHPQLLGLGIDESTAIVVQRDTFAVVGAGKVFVHGGRDAADAGAPYRTLTAGDRYDLRGRRVVAADR